MSREIKFRAWHKERKVMLHDGDIFLEDHHPREWIGKIVEPLIVTNYGLLYWILETKLPNATDEHYDHRNLYNRGLKIMQYTGLKDKNEVDLYEQDVIDENGVKAGNAYESYYLNPTTYLIIAGLGTKKWSSTEQEAIKRGCFYAE